MRALIISSGSFDMETFKKHRLAKDIIICADGGANHIYKTGVKPDMIVGDLDSIDDETLLYYQEQNVLFHKFSSKKDLTDTELAINFALEEGANELVLFGSTGSRLDHTLGNIMLLYKLLKQNIKVSIIDKNNEIYITDKELEVEREDDTFVSLIPLSKSCDGIGLEGFKYSAQDLVLPFGSTMGISNQVEDEKGLIGIKDGTTLVIKSKDN